MKAYHYYKIILCYVTKGNWTRECEFSFPEEVLAFIRHLVPGNVKGEIREVGG